MKKKYIKPTVTKTEIMTPEIKSLLDDIKLIEDLTGTNENTFDPAKVFQLRWSKHINNLLAPQQRKNYSLSPEITVKFLLNKLCELDKKVPENKSEEDITELFFVTEWLYFKLIHEIYHRK